MNREERQQARTDRYRELADNARKQSEQCFRQSESMASVIPMGQPVHGKADRNYREKIWNKMGQSVKASEKADYYERKAEAAENNNAIYLDDDNAVEKLEQKLAELVKAQEDMKAANKVVKNKKLTEEEKKVRLMELGYSEKKCRRTAHPVLRAHRFSVILTFQQQRQHQPYQEEAGTGETDERHTGKGIHD